MEGHATTIHLEGMDLAGKTSACRALAAVLGGRWRVRRNSLCPHNPVYELADRLRKEGRYSGAALGQLYVAALMADLEGHVPPAEETIQDSTILLRSLAYHAVAGTPGVAGALRDLLPRHPRFTLSVVLTAGREARLRRLQRRRQQDPREVSPDDLLVVTDPGRFFAMEGVLVRLAREHFGAVVLDTSGLPEGAVVDRVLGALAARRRPGPG